MKELIVDLSKYNDPVDYAGMKEAGVVAAIVKAGGSLGVDPLFYRHASGVKSAGLYLGLYYWIDPLHDGATQARHFVKLAGEVNADFLAGDIEQWWADWSKWYAWRTGKLIKSAVPVLTPKQIYRTATQFISQVDLMRPSLRCLAYSSTGFVNSFCPELFPWLNTVPFWLAQYPATGPVPTLKRIALTWKKLIAEYLPKSSPLVPVHAPRPAMWQWSGDRFITESVDSPLDMNLFMRDESFSSWLDRDAPTPEPQPFITMRLNNKTWGLNVRAQPNANCEILRVLVKTSVFTVVPGYGTWAKLYGEPGYVHSAYIVPRIEL